VQAQLKAIDSLYQDEYNFSESQIYKTTAQLHQEQLNAKRKESLVTTLGRICFEMNDLDYWMKKLDLQRYSFEHFDQRPNG
jgi:hypothetical protein